MRQLLNREDEVVDPGALGAVFPFAVVADAVDFVVEADGAAHAYVGLYSDVISRQVKMAHG